MVTEAVIHDTIVNLISKGGDEACIILDWQFHLIYRWYVDI